MISFAHRFHGNNALNYVYRNGRTLRSKYFSAKYIANSKRDTYRAAVVVSKKVAKRAPIRNRIRRRLYELIRQADPELLANNDIVITIFDAGVADIDHAELQEVFSRMIADIKN